jgi:hypothetical protein
MVIMKSRIIRWFLTLIVVGVVLFILIQFVPYGHNLDNPAPRVEPKWDSEQTKALVRRACFDCHSNETAYPWYARIAPSSWLLQKDVTEARSAMNFSDWENANLSADQIIRQVEAGRMPPLTYGMMHPEARFSDIEKQQFIEGIRATLK